MPDLFFPPLGLPKIELLERIDAAKSVCAHCPFFTACEEASAGETYGVWAGQLKEAPNAKRRHRADQREPAGV